LLSFCILIRLLLLLTPLFLFLVVVVMLCLQRTKVQPSSQHAAAAAAASLALSVVGKRVEVWWEDDQQYYAGRITHYNKGVCSHAPGFCASLQHNAAAAAVDTMHVLVLVLQIMHQHIELGPAFETSAACCPCPRTYLHLQPLASTLLSMMTVM
jgi:hypothetical protein